MLSLTLAIALIVAFLPKPSMARRGQRVGVARQEELLAAIAAELRAGSSLRHALATAADGHAELSRAGYLAQAGAPMSRVVDAIGSDPRLRAAIVVAAESGGRAALVFSRLADRVAAETEEARQRRVLTAQARLSAAVVAALPLVWLIVGGVGRIRTLVAAGAGAIAGVGLLLESIGLALVWRLARR